MEHRLLATVVTPSTRHGRCTFYSPWSSHLPLAMGRRRPFALRNVALPFIDASLCASRSWSCILQPPTNCSCEEHAEANTGGGGAVDARAGADGAGANSAITSAEGSGGGCEALAPLVSRLMNRTALLQRKPVPPSFFGSVVTKMLLTPSCESCRGSNRSRALSLQFSFLPLPFALSFALAITLSVYPKKDKPPSPSVLHSPYF